MQEIDKKMFIFNIKEIHFSKNPFDVNGCDFVIFPYCNNKIKAKGFFCYNKLTSIIDLNQNLDTIWKKFHTNTIRGIKRAEKNCINIKINQHYDQFYQIYKNFLKQKRLKSFFEPFGVGIIPLNIIKNKGTLFVAEYNGEILGGIVSLVDTSNIEYWIGASKRLECQKDINALIGCANRLIFWEAIKYAKERGIKEFDLGGYWPENEAKKDLMKSGINSFKSSFGGEVIQGYSYAKGYSKSLTLAYYLYNFKKRRIPG